ncbi:hypothetical protein GPECTOR_226g498 [Gonium pectorale]|uniref:Uncharacterized protein n=1 Tax=Gonium pectorale TaxID=33097 RepID=A0A150FWL1_GONPE|nr:hypothetical protein GPECTOR_226g498 [Gonium pectorale]|eukprot:KXZ42003.1 hypothetical protein GPECTOR_226g498 [Gonium pectorale]
MLGKGPPMLDFTNVTKHNFAAVLPVLRAAIQEATFVAIDTEFTGLHPEGYGEDLYDTYEERYKRLLASSSNFIVCQFGLTAFKWGPSGWEARAFNAYLFPQPDDNAGWDKRFLCQASSLAYLASQGFDFNKMIRDGIGYLPLSLLDGRARGLQEAADNQQRSMELKNAQEEEAVAEWRGRVLAWLRDGGGGGSGSGEAELRLPLPHSRRLRSLLKLVVQSYQLPSLGHSPFSLEEAGGSGGAAAAGADGRDGAEGAGAGTSFPSASMEEDGDEEGEGSASSSDDGGGGHSGSLPEGWLVLRRLDRWPSRELLVSGGMQMTARQQLELLDEKSGFSTVLAALRDARRPVVAHNSAFDLAYTLAQFAEPLPRSWPEYKAMVQRFFPGGLYDTKYIAQQLAAQYDVPFTDTSLGALYTALTNPAWLRFNVPGVDMARVGAGGLPEISLAPGFTEYSGVTDKAHEAGYDSLMTGAVFARLLRIAEVRAAGRNSARPPPSSTDGAGAQDSAAAAGHAGSGGAADALLQPLQQYRGRVHMMRSDLPYADMYGTDPVPLRPAMLHVSGFTPNTRPSFLQQRFQNVGLGQVQVTMLRGPNGGAEGALVLLPRVDMVQTALATARKRWPTFQVTTFAEFYSRSGREGASSPPSSSSPPQQQQPQQRGQQRQGGQGEGAQARASPRMIRTPPPAAAGGSAAAMVQQFAKAAEKRAAQQEKGAPAAPAAPAEATASPEARAAAQDPAQAAPMSREAEPPPAAASPSVATPGTGPTADESGRKPAAQAALATEKLVSLSLAAQKLKGLSGGKEQAGGGGEPGEGPLQRPTRRRG